MTTQTTSGPNGSTSIYTCDKCGEISDKPMDMVSIGALANTYNFCKKDSLEFETLMTDWLTTK